MRKPFKPQEKSPRPTSPPPPELSPRSAPGVAQPASAEQPSSSRNGIAGNIPLADIAKDHLILMGKGVKLWKLDRKGSRQPIFIYANYGKRTLEFEVKHKTKQIALEDIHEIRTGRASDSLTKKYKDIPEETCFAIVSTAQTLELQMDDEGQRKQLIEALTKTVEVCRKYSSTNGEGKKEEESGIGTTQ